MPNDLIIFLGGLLPIIWGIAHLIPTKAIVSDFGEISNDNKIIIKMEWVYEGLTMIFIGSLVIISTLLFGSSNNVVQFIYLANIVMLLIMAIWSLLTGFKVDFLPFRLCPLIFSAAALLIIIGAII